MTPEAYFSAMENRLQRAAVEALRTSAPRVEEHIREQIEPQRIKTRKAVRARMRRRTLRVSLEFDKQYRHQNTATERHWNRTVRKAKPVLKDIIEEAFFELLGLLIG